MEKVTFIYPPGSLNDRRELQVRRWDEDRFLDFLQFQDRAGILHLGCGDGAWTKEVATRYPLSVVVGLDPYAPNIALAKRDPNPNLYFVQGDVHFLPFEDGRFDLVFLRYLLASAIDPFQILTEIRRVLKPNGEVFIQEDQMLLDQIYPECPQFEAIWRKIAVLQQEFRQDPWIGKKLHSMLKDIGYQRIRASAHPEVICGGTSQFKTWVDQLKDNIDRLASSLKASGLCNEGQLGLAFRELDALRNETGALVSASMMRVIARSN